MGFHPQALQILLSKPSAPLIDPTIHKGHGCFVLDIQKPLLRDECSPQYDNDDDTASTASLSSESDDEDEDRRVSFADTLVTEEWERETTPKEEIPDLFYTTEQMSRFRQEYRLERKLLSELAIDPDSFPVEESEELTDLLDSSSRQGARHRISRVVVLHNDKLETFFNREEPVPCEKIEEVPPPPGDDFFDNDSFWSGSITWY